MNREGLHVWRKLTEDGSVRFLKYTFGPGTANTLAVRLDDGTWLVVSPATGVAPGVLDELANEGPVSALVAPNAYHHLGQPLWRARFPSAVSYAAEDAISRLQKKSPDVPYRSTSELPEQSVRIVTPLGMKSPDLLLSVTISNGVLWWMGDLFTNSTATDQVWWLRRIIAPLAGSGLGYRRNSKPKVIYVRDPVVWLGSVRDAVTSRPPSIVVPAHGDPVTEDTARQTQALLREAS